MTLRHDPRPAIPAAHRPAPARRIRGGTLIGVFIGVVVGLAIAAGVAFYLMRGGNPYQSTTAAKDRDVTSGRNAKGEPGKPRFDFYKILPGGEEPKATARVPGGVEKVPAERPLTSPDKAGGPDQRPAPADVARNPSDARTASIDPRPPAPEGRAGDRFWLQAGSFASPGDAENLKARLALAGWEAAVQEADVPDKGVRYRVRLGPYDNTEELNRMRGELVRRGFDVAVIKF